ncbi:unnamed protein product [Hermetia illucens]|uniref:Uncharacterized protein n=1 Tax=Hermetia illucens TaxID=343691 RepID=A0A7R8YWB8_HERIL|nr:unnamed protein product [Hermetia illucens]
MGDQGNGPPAIDEKAATSTAVEVNGTGNTPASNGLGNASGDIGNGNGGGSGNGSGCDSAVVVENGSGSGGGSAGNAVMENGSGSDANRDDSVAGDEQNAGNALNGNGGGDGNGGAEMSGGHHLDTACSDGGPSSLLGVGPPSPLTGCYLLIILGEPHSEEHKDIILQRLIKDLGEMKHRFEEILGVPKLFMRGFISKKH